MNKKFKILRKVSEPIRGIQLGLVAILLALATQSNMCSPNTPRSFEIATVCEKYNKIITKIGTRLGKDMNSYTIDLKGSESELVAGLHQKPLMSLQSLVEMKTVTLTEDEHTSFNHLLIDISKVKEGTYDETIKNIKVELEKLKATENTEEDIIREEIKKDEQEATEEEREQTITKSEASDEEISVLKAQYKNSVEVMEFLDRMIFDPGQVKNALSLTNYMFHKHSGMDGYKKIVATKRGALGELRRGIVHWTGEKEYDEVLKEQGISQFPKSWGMTANEKEFLEELLEKNEVSKFKSNFKESLTRSKIHTWIAIMKSNFSGATLRAWNTYLSHKYKRTDKNTTGADWVYLADKWYHSTLDPFKHRPTTAAHTTGVISRIVTNRMNTFIAEDVTAAKEGNKEKALLPELVEQLKDWQNDLASIKAVR